MNQSLKSFFRPNWFKVFVVDDVFYDSICSKSLSEKSDGSSELEESRKLVWVDRLEREESLSNRRKLWFCKELSFLFRRQTKGEGPIEEGKEEAEAEEDEEQQKQQVEQKSNDK